MRKLLVIAAFVTALLPCGPGLGFPAALASGTGETGPSPTLQSSFQGSGRDVAVTSIAQAVYGPPVVKEGDTITIAIGVANNGDSEETFTVSLRDDTEDKEIGSQQVTLAAGESTTVNIAWDTTGARRALASGLENSWGAS